MADEVKLIDRDEVGAKIQAMYIRREIDYGGENEFCRGMRKALRIIEDAPTVEVQPDNGWISVDDRLPDAIYDCLVWYSCDTVFGKSKSWGIAHCSRGDWYTKYLDGDNIVVLYWLPLPEPPKGEK